MPKLASRLVSGAFHGALKPLTGNGGPELAPRLAISITVVVICGFYVVAATFVLRMSPSWWVTGGCGVTLLSLLLLQLAHSFPDAVPRMANHRHLTLGLQALLTYLPFLAFKDAWLGMPGFLAGSAVLVLQRTAAWLCFGLVVASVVVIQFAVGRGSADVAYNGVSTLITGLVVFGLSRLADLVREVHAARSEVAALAVTQERLRFARDLHDLLGYSLSTIAVKCELARRMVSLEPAKAEQELSEVLGAARQALADIRAVASGYRAASLASEVTAAESVLEAVGIHTATRIQEGDLSQTAINTLAMVVREGVTNLLRHSKARRCRIEVQSDADTVCVSIHNDGASARSGVLGGDPGRGGNGIANLTERVEALGGRLTARAGSYGWFHLSARLPLRPAECGTPEALTANPTSGLSARHPSDCAR